MFRSSQEIGNLVVTMSAKGISRRKIAWELRISRNTVRRILEEVRDERRKGHSVLPRPPIRRGSKLDRHEGFIKAKLEEFPDLTAVRLHEMLCEEEGFDGGYTIVRELLRRLRPKPKKKPVTPFETEPGKQGQQDWSPYKIDFTEAGRIKVCCFSLVLGYSRRQYIRFCQNEKFITLIREHVKAFEYFGGVPEEILYDGQKAVLLRWEADLPIYNPSFLSFATHYSFRPHALRPKRPDLKGKVERPFEYLETNLFNGRHFRDPEHLGEVASWWLANRADVRIHGTLKQRPIDRFVVEVPHLQPLPAHPYDTAEVSYRVVSTAGLVACDVTPYSVPVAHILDVVVVRVTENEVFVYDSDIREIACHERAPQGHREPVINPDHRPKKKTRYDIDALVARLGELSQAGALFAAGVLERQRFRGSHLARVLGLLEQYSADDLAAALERAVRYRAFDGSVVQRIVEANATPRVLPNTAKQAAAERLKYALTPTFPRSMTAYAAAISGNGSER
ncbi:MAG: IS21 family transposase [Deltaproteobacteria bacterium]|nr:IS21 family transposase [Deltaproteobacteria bacterium]